MKPLSRRERLLRALNHQEPDQVPVDFGGTTATGIFAGAYQALKEHLGLALDRPLRPVYPYTQLVHVDEEIVARLGGEVRPIERGDTNILHYADRPTDLAERGFIDEFGVVFSRPEGSPYANVFRPVFDRPDPALLSQHRWPDVSDPARVAGIKAHARHLRETTDYALAIGLPGRFLSFGQNLCGFAEFMVYLASEPRFVAALLDRALEVQAGTCAQVLDELGDDIDVVMFNDDLGTQQNLQLSPRLYRALIKPRQKQLFETVRRHSRAKILFHSDGAIANVIPDLIEVGIDALNPVQPTCAGMDTAKLKREFGRDLCFWGGVDTQRVLPFGTPAEVAEEVRRRIDDLAPGGGYVLAAVHNLQPDVPPENIVALFDAARAYGGYAST